MLGNNLFLSAAAALAFLAKARADHHLVVGAAVPSEGDVPLRLNVNDLQATAGPQWDLYVQALRAMQDMDSDDKLSYFQTAGMLTISRHPRCCLLTSFVQGSTACLLFSGTMPVPDGVPNGSATVLMV